MLAGLLGFEAGVVEVPVDSRCGTLRVLEGLIVCGQAVTGAALVVPGPGETLLGALFGMRRLVVSTGQALGVVEGALSGLGCFPVTPGACPCLFLFAQCGLQLFGAVQRV
ncbi:hypothetical protein [Streptomyces sp. NPDC003032]